MKSNVMRVWRKKRSAGFESLRMVGVSGRGHQWIKSVCMDRKERLSQRFRGRNPSYISAVRDSKGDWSSLQGVKQFQDYSRKLWEILTQVWRGHPTLPKRKRIKSQTLYSFTAYFF